MRWFFRKCSDWWKFDPEKQKCWLCERQSDLANQRALLWLRYQWEARITHSWWHGGDESETLRGISGPGATLLTTEADKYYLDCDTGDSRLMKRRVAGGGNMMGRNATITLLSSTNLFALQLPKDGNYHSRCDGPECFECNISSLMFVCCDWKHMMMYRSVGDNFSEQLYNTHFLALIRPQSSEKVTTTTTLLMTRWKLIYFHHFHHFET